MALPVTIPNTFANATSSIPLSQLDTNFSTLANAVNGLNSGSETLANLKATTANVGVLTVTGNATIGDASTDTVTLNSTLTANTAVIFAAGTSAAPSITTTGDLNTGIFFPAADTIAFAEGGAEAMRIDSSGNVGIGTNSPTNRLHVAATAQDIALFTYNSTTGLIKLKDGTTSNAPAIGVTGDVLQFFTGSGPTERMRIDSSGNVGIGTSSPAEKLDIAGLYIQAGDTRTNNTNKLFGLRMPHYANATTAVNLIGAVSTSTDNAIYIGGNDTSIGGTAATVIAFYTAGNNTTSSGTERARITSDGDFIVGTTASVSPGSNRIRAHRSSGTVSIITSTGSLGNGDAVYFSSANNTGPRYCDIGVYKHSGITNSAAYIFLQKEDSNNSYVWTGNDGNLRISSVSTDIGTNGGTVVGTQTSDERLKDISGSVSYGLNEVLLLEPISFAFKDRPDVQKIGFSAQQVQPIVPEAVYDSGECLDGYDIDPENRMLQTPKSDRTKLAMEYTQLIPVLVNAVKELKAITDAQATRIEALEAEVAALKGQ